jgi:small-conductance mechanosensitive channel
MESIPVISLGAAAFWIALAAVLIAGGWHKVRREQIKQETLLRLIEKTGQLDEALVKAMFPPPPPPSPWPPPWHHQPDPLAAQRGLRVGGVVLMGVAVGVAVLGLVLRSFGTGQQLSFGLAILGLAGVVAGLAAGLLIASKFAAGPVARDEHD